MSGSLTQFGVGKESTYGTAVVPTAFYEIISEDFKGSYPRLQAEGLSAALVDRSDRFAVTNKGASGSVSLEPLSKGFGNLLSAMMGTVATGAVQETSVYTHTATMGNLTGKNLTVQVGRADSASVVRPWTYEGGKVTGFEFSNQVDQTLRSSLSFDFEKESNPDAPAGAYALATATLPTAAQIFTWQGGTITIGGSPVDISEFSVRVDNALKSDRYFIAGAGSASKREPVQDGKRKVTWSFKTPYDNNNFWERVASATNAGTYAAISAIWEAPTLIGTTLYPRISFSIPVARFDEGGPSVSGPSMIDQTFTGVGLYDGTNSALEIAYRSTDVTVFA
jgi:hypothetical protein